MACAREPTDNWKKKVQEREEKFKAKPKLQYSTYAEAVKGNGSAPGMMNGALGSDAQEMEENGSSTISPVVSNIETQATAVREEHPVQPTIIHHYHEHTTVHNHHYTVFVCGPQYMYNQCDFRSNDQNVFRAGDNASFQIGNQNGMNFQESP